MRMCDWTFWLHHVFIDYTIYFQQFMCNFFLLKLLTFPSTWKQTKDTKKCILDRETLVITTKTFDSKLLEETSYICSSFNSFNGF